MFRKILLGFFLLLVLLVGAVLVAPSLLDWNKYRDTITTELRDITGRDMVIRGDLSLTILPELALSAELVRLGNMRGAAEPDMLSLESIKIRLEPVALLSGRIEVASVALIRPRVVVERMPDGRLNWMMIRDKSDGTVTIDLEKKTAPDTSPDAPVGAASEDVATAPPATSPIAPADGGGLFAQAESVRLNEVEIKDGTLVLRNQATGLLEEIGEITATVSADTLRGPFRGEGRFTYHGVTMTFFGSLDGVSPQAKPLSASITLPDAGALMRFNGTMSYGFGQWGLRGDAQLQGDSLQAVVLAAMPDAPMTADLAVPFDVDASLDLANDRLDISNVQLRMEQTQGQVDMLVAFNQPRTPRAPPEGQKSQGEQKDAPPPILDRSGSRVTKVKLDARFARIGLDQFIDSNAMETAFGLEEGETNIFQVKLPKNMEFQVNAQADAILYRGAPVNTFALDAAVLDGDVILRKLSMILPGETEIGARGFIATAQGDARVNGSWEMRTDNVRDTLTWLGNDVSSVPRGKLRYLQARSKVLGTLAKTEFKELLIRLDSTQLTGAANVEMRGDRPSVGLLVAVDLLDLDSYMPTEEKPVSGFVDEAQPAAAAVEQVVRRPEDMPPLFADLDLLNDFDMNFRGRLESMTLFGVAMRTITVGAVLQSGQLTFADTGVGDAAGVSASVKGTVLGFGEHPRFRDVEYNIAASQVGVLARNLELDLPLNPSDLGKVALAGKINGTLDALDVETRTQGGGVTLDVVGRLGSLRWAPSADVNIGIQHENFGGMVRLLAPRYRPQAGGMLGGFSLAGRFTGDFAQAALQDLKVTAGPFELLGDISLDNRGDRPRVKATLNGGELPLHQFMPASRLASLEQPAPGNWREVIRHAARDLAAIVPVQYADDGWSNEAFDLALIKDVDSDISFNTVALLYDPFRVDNLEVRLTAAQGVARLHRMVGRMFGGDVEVSGDLDARSTPMLRAEGRVVRARIDGPLFETSFLDIAGGRADLNAAVQAQGDSPLAMIESLNGEGKISVTDGVFNGFALDTLAEQMKRLYDVGGITQLVANAMAGGSSPFRNFSATVLAENGTISFKDGKMNAASGEGRMAGYVDLTRMSTQIDAQFKLEVLKDAPPFGFQIKGPLAGPQKYYNTDNLRQYALTQGTALIGQIRGVGSSEATGGLGSIMLQQTSPADQGSLGDR